MIGIKCERGSHRFFKRYGERFEDSEGKQIFLEFADEEREHPRSAHSGIPCTFQAHDAQACGVAPHPPTHPPGECLTLVIRPID